MDKYFWDEQISGDSKTPIDPTLHITGFETSVKPPLALAIVTTFKAQGFYTFDAVGADMWVAVQYCILAKVPFKLEGQLGIGFTVSLTHT